jgi:hypothetical protein
MDHSIHVYDGFTFEMQLDQSDMDNKEASMVIQLFYLLSTSEEIHEMISSVTQDELVDFLNDIDGDKKHAH